MIALTRDATAEDIVKTMFLLKLPDSVRKAMWAEPLKDWSEMKARAKGLWHAEKTKRQAATYEVAGARAISQVDEVETNAVRFKPKGKNNQNGKKFKDFAGHVLPTTKWPVRVPRVLLTICNQEPVHHAVSRETEKPGVRSVNRGRLTNPARRQFQQNLPCRHGRQRSASCPQPNKRGKMHRWKRNWSRLTVHVSGATER